MFIYRIIRTDLTSGLVTKEHFDEEVVISEGSGISPLSIAAAFAHVYPSIESAADRLHTRSDIEWSPIFG